jgi:PilZ domain
MGAAKKNPSDQEFPLDRSLYGRDPRYPSHALIDVSTSKWNPFAESSAVLLDLSQGGFKIEFVNPVELKTGMKINLSIRLSPFGILTPETLRLKAEVKWFDREKLRCGGLFSSPSETEFYVLDKIIAQIQRH